MLTAHSETCEVRHPRASSSEENRQLGMKHAMYAVVEFVTPGKLLSKLIRVSVPDFTMLEMRRGALVPFR